MKGPSIFKNEDCDSGSGFCAHGRTGRGTGLPKSTPGLSTFAERDQNRKPPNAERALSELRASLET